jgi:WD40 repeat protein
MILATSKYFLVYEDGKVGVKIPYPEEFLPTCLINFRDGFFAAGEGRTVYRYNFTPEGKRSGFKRDLFEILLPEDASTVRTLQLNLSEEALLVQTQTHQIYCYHLETELNIDNIKMPTAADIMPDKKPMASANALLMKMQPAKYERWFPNFHHGAITGLSNCVRKPIMITSSTDKSVRIWNYINGECLLTKYFGEEAHGVSIHPAALYALVGFTDKLRMYDIQRDEMRLHKEFNIRLCKEVRLF